MKKVSIVANFKRSVLSVKVVGIHMWKQIIAGGAVVLEGHVVKACSLAFVRAIHHTVYTLLYVSQSSRELEYTTEHIDLHANHTSSAFLSELCRD